MTVYGDEDSDHDKHLHDAMEVSPAANITLDMDMLCSLETQITNIVLKKSQESRYQC